MKRSTWESCLLIEETIIEIRKRIRAKTPDEVRDNLIEEVCIKNGISENCIRAIMGYPKRERKKKSNDEAKVIETISENDIQGDVVETSVILPAQNN